MDLSFPPVRGSLPAPRRARAADVVRIRELVRPLVRERVLVPKEAVSYYEGVQEFWVLEEDGVMLGCGALHVMWEDLAEVRTLAVSEEARGRGVGSALLGVLLGQAQELGVDRVFCLTFEVDFFTRHGFEVMKDQEGVEAEVYAELLRSHDEGVAEFLDLARVKPNTLGNTRMIIRLSAN